MEASLFNSKQPLCLLKFKLKCIFIYTSYLLLGGARGTFTN